METITNLINQVQNRKPQYRFTGNLFNLFPELLNFAPLDEKLRINYTLTPIQKSWYFMYNNKPFNFYPIFLKLTSINTGIQYKSISYKLNLKQSARAAASNYIKITTKQ